ncbi:unnamed protein product, partial [Allacma fusca]
HSHHENNQFMGALPGDRIIPTDPFNKVAIDYGGPFITRLMNGRSNTTFKSYLMLSFPVFIDLYLEDKRQPKSSATIAAIVGADRKLKKFLQLIASNETNAHITQELLKEDIKWNFNPPAAPHMGGIWEAGITSVKWATMPSLSKNLRHS